MRLYAGPSTHFIRDTTHNQIAEKLRTAFFEHYRSLPSPNEVQSWQNSLRATAMVFQEAELDDHGVILEYQLPLSSRRLDCIVTGPDRDAGANAVIMELKQWSAVDGASVVGDKVVTWVGGGHRDVLHPSLQAGQYRQYLEDNHEGFYADDPPSGCAPARTCTTTTSGPTTSCSRSRSGTPSRPTGCSRPTTSGARVSSCVRTWTEAAGSTSCRASRRTASGPARSSWTTWRR